MPLFQLNDGKAQQIRAGRFDLERNLQRLIEANLEEIFGIHFIATEFTIRGEQSGRIDTLGLDSDGAPAIVEYKREKNDTVINQGLYYVNWVLEHRGDFHIAAQKVLGQTIEVNWDNPRLIIVAQNYQQWDIYSVKHMGQSIELWEYVLYGNDLLYLNQVYGQPRPTAKPATIRVTNEPSTEQVQYFLETHLSGKPKHICEIFHNIRDGILNLGSDSNEIIETIGKLYVGYRHGKNFCEIQVMKKELKLHLDIPISNLDDPQKLARDVTNIGHWGTGHTEVRVSSLDEADYILSLIEQSYRFSM